LSSFLQPINGFVEADITVFGGPEFHVWCDAQNN
jgi:hypothetical protein